MSQTHTLDIALCMAFCAFVNILTPVDFPLENPLIFPFPIGFVEIFGKITFPLPLQSLINGFAFYSNEKLQFKKMIF